MSYKDRIERSPESPKYPKFYQLPVGTAFEFQRATRGWLMTKIEPEWRGKKIVNAIGQHGKIRVRSNTPTNPLLET